MCCDGKQWYLGAACVPQTDSAVVGAGEELVLIVWGPTHRRHPPLVGGQSGLHHGGFCVCVCVGGCGCMYVCE